MYKYLIALFFAFNLITANSKEVFDTNLNLECYANKNFTVENFVSSFLIEVKKIDWNKDPSSPPKWGSSQNIKVKNSGQSNDASLLLSRKKQIAFSFAESNDVESSNTTLYIFELDLDKLEMKKTSISIFSRQNNRINNSILHCKKTS